MVACSYSCKTAETSNLITLQWFDIAGVCSLQNSDGISTDAAMLLKEAVCVSHLLSVDEFQE